MSTCLSACVKEGFATGNTKGTSQDDLVNLQQLTALMIRNHPKHAT